MFIPKVRLVVLIASLALTVLGVVTGSTRTANAESRIGTGVSARVYHPLLERSRDEGGWLSQAQNTPNAGSLVGSSFTISAGAAQEVSPAIAYNSQAQEYLVAWYNDLPGNDDIHVELVSRDGKLLKHTCVACGVGAERRYPDVAYNSQDKEYLVVWVEENSTTALSSIKAQRLWADGTQKGSLKGSLITVFGGVAGYQIVAHPAVAYASTTNKYLVVWQLPVIQPGGSVDGILGRVVNGNGSTPSSDFIIYASTPSSPARQPDVAYNRHANGFLVVWQQGFGTDWDIYGELVHGDGSILPGPLIHVDDSTNISTAPAVAAIPTAAGAYKYVVVWEHEFSSSDHDIYGKLVQEDGTPHPTSVVITGSADDESELAVAGDESAQQYLVAWSRRKGIVNVPIRVRAVNTVGTLMYNEAELGGPTAHYPAVAAGPVGDFMVAWQDRSVFATHTDLYGQFWGNRSYLPLTLR